MVFRSMARPLATGLGAVALVGVLTVEASAQKYSAAAGTFVGTAAQCGGAAGAKLVSAAWVNGLGLLDIGFGGIAHQGLLLSKNGPTANCSSAGADITGWTPGGTLSALGFDYRLGGHCGAGAPRFNVTSGENTYFFGCFSGTASAAPEDAANWRRVVFDGAGGPYPGAEGFVFGVTTVDSIQIVFDEGTDTPSPDGNAPAGVGLTTLDNIRISNTLITKKRGTPIVP